MNEDFGDMKKTKTNIIKRYLYLRLSNLRIKLVDAHLENDERKVVKLQGQIKEAAKTLRLIKYGIQEAMYDEYAELQARDGANVGYE